MPSRVWMQEPLALPASGCFRRIKLETSSALCGHSDTMDVRQPTRFSSRSRTEECVPTLVQIPAGWFLMGCDRGQDNEKPVHRVWTDEFLLAALQVTNADYERFLRATAPSSLPPPFWSDPEFNHPKQ